MAAGILLPDLLLLGDWGSYYFEEVIVHKGQKVWQQYVYYTALHKNTEISKDSQQF